LSKATTSTPASACNASPRRISRPSAAARPVATMIEVGVASPIAQGHATISTATALTSAMPSAGAGPASSQTRKVSAASAITPGTKYSATRSTSA
jgi:hypothetical protein